MIQATEEEFIRTLNRVVASKPKEYRYPSESAPGSSGLCLYFGPDGTPYCLFGELLNELGVTYEVLKSEYGLDVYDEPVDIYDLLDEISDYSEELKNAALDAQRAQDYGETWPDALKAFNRTLASKNPTLPGSKL